MRRAPSVPTYMKAVRSLTSGNVFKVLLLYCLPLFGSAMIQQAYSLADLLIVGNFAADGQAALTSIGEANTVVNILLAFALGANNGCSVVVAKHFGAGDNKGVRESVNTAAIAFSVLCAAVMTVGFACAQFSMVALSVEEQFVGDSLTYLYIYTGSLPFVFFYNLACGISSALGDSKTPFLFLVFSSVLNVGLDFALVCGAHLDVAGAAWATFISQALACGLTWAVISRKIISIKCDERAKKFNPSILKDLVKTSIPVILQQAFVSVGNLFVMKRINMLGDDSAAGFTAAFKLIGMANMGVVNMTGGLANFASQNKAAGEYGRIKKGFLAVLAYTELTSVVFGVTFIAASRPLSLMFINNPTEGAIADSAQFLTIVSCFLPVVCCKIVADGAVRGCGGNIGFTVSTFTDLILRIAFVYILTEVGLGFSGVCWAWAIGWGVSCGLAVIFYLNIKCLKKPKLPEESKDGQNA